MKADSSRNVVGKVSRRAFVSAGVLLSFSVKVLQWRAVKLKAIHCHRGMMGLQSMRFLPL